MSAQIASNTCKPSIPSSRHGSQVAGEACDSQQMSVSLSDRLKNLADRFGPPQALRQRGQADRKLPLTCQAAGHGGTSSSRRQITP
jgi:hypothetical protein